MGAYDEALLDPSLVLAGPPPRELDDPAVLSNLRTADGRMGFQYLLLSWLPDGAVGPLVVLEEMEGTAIAPPATHVEGTALVADGTGSIRCW